jgi:hypothetical protein
MFCGFEMPRIYFCKLDRIASNLLGMNVDGQYLSYGVLVAAYLEIRSKNHSDLADIPEIGLQVL